MLLIGDKVVTHSPPAVTYPYQMDLGEAWHELTGLPFVFAIWMTRAGTDLGPLPAALRNLRRKNSTRVDQIASTWAPRHGWPTDLAHTYLTTSMRYTIGPDELSAIEYFAQLAYQLGLIDYAKPVRSYPLGFVDCSPS
ncbi:MAG: hypothetical protein IT443_10905 [Phycisphaeraceae bacterium]|nr:hypothetical protein [Phycisphaeraceae bacterium]